jgi:probable addiction module antidote protein
MALEISDFDPADYLDSDEVIAAYLSEALESGDPVFVADALGAVARARGMTALARATGLSRESLYRALSARGNPELGTILRIMNALNLRLAAVAMPRRRSSKAPRRGPRRVGVAGTARTGGVPT